MQDGAVQTAQSFALCGQILRAMTESHTLLEYNSNEKLWWNLDKSDTINPAAETKGEFSE